MPEREPWDSAREGRQSAGLNPNAIAAWMLEVKSPSLTKLQELPLPFPDRATFRLGGNCLVRKCQCHDGISRIEVSLNVRGRNREHGAYPIESMPAWIFVERSRSLDIEDHSEEIMNRVRIFLSAQSIVRHRSTPRHARRCALAYLSGNGFNH